MKNLNAELAATHEMEKTARRLLEHPAVRAIQNAGETELRESLAFADPLSLTVLPAAAREIALSAVLHALLDPEYPTILFVELLPRIEDGVALPGSRVMDDNPDTVYRFIPV